MILSLEEVKQYLRVDGDEENTLITNFIAAAEEICEDILRVPLAEIDPLPETVKQAILYAAANMYEKREAVDIKDILTMITRLLFSYRKEGW